MAEASSARPLVEPKQVSQVDPDTMDEEEALEIDRAEEAVEDDKTKKKVSFTDSLMPFEKPSFDFKSGSGPTNHQMTGADMMFQQV